MNENLDYSADAAPEVLPEPPPPPELTVKVKVSPNKLSAFVTLSRSDDEWLPDPELVVQKINEALGEAGVVYGIINENITRLATSVRFSSETLIAEGVSPQDGKAAHIAHQIDFETVRKPHEREDGTVDFSDMGVVLNVETGAFLAERIPPVPGVPGTNVLGTELPPKQGRDMQLVVGKGTKLDPKDPNRLLAAIDGRPILLNKKISVMDVFAIAEDVGVATGNIDFLGSVEIKGNVFTGYTVKAKGSISISGTVDGAIVMAGGDVTILSGVNGFGKGLIQSFSSVKCKYIQSGNVQAAGDVEANYVLQSTVYSGGTVRLDPNKGVIMGGRISALKQIDTVNVGSRADMVNTILEVGNDPFVLNRAKELPDQIEQCKKNIASLQRTITLMTEYKKRGRLDTPKEDLLTRSSATFTSEFNRLNAMEAELEDIREKLQTFGYGVINIKGTAHLGTRICIGSATLTLRDEAKCCSFIRKDDLIEMVPFRGK